MHKSQLKSTDSQDYAQLKAIKYPVRPISNAIFLDKKLKSFSPTIQTTLKKYMSRELNAYRQVRGDGNCFFRAFAFTCIASKKKHELEDIFPLLDKIKLDSCKPASIPPAFRPFYDDKRLKSVLRKRWDVDFEFFLRTNRFNYKRALSRMFNENHYLDFIVVLYFRAVCLWVLQNQEKYRQYLSTEAEQITTYGCESEGVTINLCSNFFQMNIRILEVRANEVIPYDYMVLKNTFIGQQNKVDLLYSDAHYDLMEKNDDPLAEYQDQKMEEEHYSEIKISYTIGTCLECQSNAEISEETGLCSNCFNKSLENFSSFQKDSQIQGQCSQCGRKTKISQDLLMCQECLLQLQYASNNNSRIRDPPASGNYEDYFKKKKCRECQQSKRFSEMSPQQDICHDCRRRIEEESHISPSSIPSLHDRLQSKITRERKEEERKVTQAMIRSKTKLITFFCKVCNREIQVASEQQAQKCAQICAGCAVKKKSQIKAFSDIRYSDDLRQSGLESKPLASQIRGGKASKPFCVKCGKSDIFPFTNGFCRKCKI